MQLRIITFHKAIAWALAWLYKMHFHRWMQNVLLFVLSRIIIFQDLREKTYQQDLKENINLHITEGYLLLETSRPVLNENMLPTQYRGWRLCKKAIHMAKVQYCISLTNMLQTVWKMLLGKRLTFCSPLLVESIAFVTFHILIKSFSQTPGSDVCTLKSLHAIRELVWVW